MPFEFGNKLANPNKILWENTGLFWIGKQPVFGCKIGKIKSLNTHIDKRSGDLLVSIPDLCPLPL